ncbi:Uncharacterised protein [Streptococcus pneumoniae]|nr:Uncharacterised protein [Streptococcus pneumoniae]
MIEITKHVFKPSGLRFNSRSKPMANPKIAERPSLINKSV